MYSGSLPHQGQRTGDVNSWFVILSPSGQKSLLGKCSLPVKVATDRHDIKLLSVKIPLFRNK
jgi:hypothetical protein